MPLILCSCSYKRTWFLHQNITNINQTYTEVTKANNQVISDSTTFLEELFDLLSEILQILKNTIFSNNNLKKVMPDLEKKVVKYHLLL